MSELFLEHEGDADQNGVKEGDHGRSEAEMVTNTSAISAVHPPLRVLDELGGDEFHLGIVQAGVAIEPPACMYQQQCAESASSQFGGAAGGGR